MTAIQRLGETFRSYHDLYIWMVLIGGEEFKIRVKTLQAILQTLHSSDKSKLRAYDVTGRIFELHARGLSLVMVKHARLHVDGASIKVNWSCVGELSEDYEEEWAESLDFIVSGIR